MLKHPQGKVRNFVDMCAFFFVLGVLNKYNYVKKPTFRKILQQLCFKLGNLTLSKIDLCDGSKIPHFWANIRFIYRQATTVISAEARSLKARRY